MGAHSGAKEIQGVSDTSPTPNHQRKGRWDPHPDLGGEPREGPVTPTPNPLLDDTPDHNVMNVFLKNISDPSTKEPPSVVNLSEYDLQDSELSVLSRGLNFCPTPGEPDMGHLRRDMDTFHRTLRIKTFFNPQDMATKTQGVGNDQSGNTTGQLDNEGSEFDT